MTWKDSFVHETLVQSHGILKTELEAAVNLGKLCLMDLSGEAAAQVKESGADAKFIYIGPSTVRRCRLTSG